MISLQTDEIRFKQSDPASPVRDRSVYASESGAATGGAGAAAAAAAGEPAGSLAALLTGRVLRDGETILLVLRPSLWFIVFLSARFSAVVALLWLAFKVFYDHLTFFPLRHTFVYGEAAVFLIASRVMWAVLQWMGRLYLLTDQRVLRVSGVLTFEAVDFPLRKLTRIQLLYTTKERLCGLGSIEITAACGDGGPQIMLWQTIARPVAVREQVVAAMHRQKNGG